MQICSALQRHKRLGSQLSMRWLKMCNHCCCCYMPLVYIMLNCRYSKSMCESMSCLITQCWSSNFSHFSQVLQALRHYNHFKIPFTLTCQEIQPLLKTTYHRSTSPRIVRQYHWTAEYCVPLNHPEIIGSQAGPHLSSEKGNKDNQDYRGQPFHHQGATQNEYIQPRWIISEFMFWMPNAPTCKLDLRDGSPHTIWQAATLR